MRGETLINAKQARAIQSLLSGAGVADAASAAGVGERTLTRWRMEDKEFQAAYQAAQGELLHSTALSLTRLAESATAALTAALADTEPTPTRLRAAMVVLDKVLQYQNAVTLERRMAQLENGDDDGDIGNENSKN